MLFFAHMRIQIMMFTVHFSVSKRYFKIKFVIFFRVFNLVLPVFSLLFIFEKYSLSDIKIAEKALSVIYMFKGPRRIKSNFPVLRWVKNQTM